MTDIFSENLEPENPSQHHCFVDVAINVPLRKTFQYKLSSQQSFEICAGLRVEVPFSGRTKIGIITKVSSHSDYPINKIKSVNRILDDSPLVNENGLKLINWMQNYYHAPPGDVWQTVLPTALLKGEPCALKRVSRWQLTQEGSEAFENNKIANNAVKQKQAMQLLAKHSNGISQDSLASFGLSLTTLKNLAGKKWVSQSFVENSPISDGPTVNLNTDIMVNDEQQLAIDSVSESLNQYQSWLLFGVTASGKTEVYLRIIEAVIKQGKQALVLVPEIGLTPQTVSRFQNRFNTPIEMLHSKMTEQQRLQSWLKARSGEARIIIGTRSALFVPMSEPGIIIIDEEHDSSFKQQQGLRYSARDIAMLRGSIEKIPVLLGSASPSIDTLMNVKKNKIKQLLLTKKALTNQALTYRVIDLKNQPMRHGLSFTLIDGIKHHLKQQGQVLLFLNRRGYSPVLLCHHCGWSSQCKRCDSHFTYHHKSNHLQCHHCGSNRRAPSQCPECLTDEMVPVGLGTERLEESIKLLFPEARVKRIDRDTTRKKSAMDDFVKEIKAGEVDILIGTQMLAKGHHFPDVSLVGLIDMDGALYSSDFRAPEYAAQLITQVSGRAGRANKKGEILIQTHLADHPMLNQLIHNGYAAFAESALNERIEAELPPQSFNALFQAEATYLPHAKTFLQEVKNLLNKHNSHGVDLLGPVPAFYSKKAGKFRFQLYLETAQRSQLHRLLDSCLADIEKFKSAGRVRWRMEVDPIGD